MASSRPAIRAMVLPRLALLALLAPRVGALVPTLRRPAAQRAVARALDDDIFAEMGGGDALFPASADDALGHPDHDYLRDDDGSCAVDLDAVNGLLAERLDAKRDRDFPRADELRDELMRAHGVRVWDRERTWSAQPKNSFRRREPRPLPEAHDYARGGDLAAPVDAAAVDALLLARMHAKMGRDFGRADALREELSRDHGVRVHDGTKTWIAGVAAANTDPWARPADDYARAPGRDDGAVDLDEAAVVALVQRRSTARRKQNWALADHLLDDLLMIGVDVDDKSKTWRAVSTTYDFPRDLVEDAGVDVDAVQRLIAKRSRLKLRRKFHEADGIRDALLAEHNVHIDDKKRTWSMQKRRLGTKAELVPALEDLD